ncbi:MAG: hypothetical protein IJ658_08915 [Kiritimatiellae bacterium]|nr:hypothetical protein [Kiritimatiellia bacterium]
MDRFGGYTPGRATRFYVPLLVQAFSQCLTYPLVAAIVSHGPLGVDTLTAFAQGQTVMFLIGAIGGGLIMTGMVFARTLAGYRNFIRLNTWMMSVLLAVQAVAALPPFDALIFRQLLNLPEGLAAVARQTLLWGIPLQAAFFVRNVPLVALFNARASAAANNATFIRILLTVLASCAFVRIGWTGAMWGLVAMTIPTIAELAFTYLFARRYVRELRDDAPADSSLTQFRFTMPLSFGGFLLASAPFMVAAFVGRTADHVAMLSIHYVTIGLANAVGYAALRMQAVTIQFPPEHDGDNRILRYAVFAGLVLGVLLLLPALPGIADWYFHTVQSIPPENVGRARVTMLIYAIWPVLQTVRGNAEGFAAVRKRPSAVLSGQIAYLATLVAVLAATLHLGTPGWLMGATAILSATAATTVAVRAHLAVCGAR